MPRYVVRKEYVEFESLIRRMPDEILDNIPGTDIYRRAMIELGFIEEVEVDSRWRSDGEFWKVNSQAQAVASPDNKTRKQENLYRLGNYFKSKKTAEEVSRAIKAVYAFIHNADCEYDQRTHTELYARIQIARFAVLADDKGEE